MSETPTVESVAKGLGMVFPDLGETHRTWMAELLMSTTSASPELANELFHVKIEESVRAGNESAIQVVVAAARRGLSI